LPEDRVAFYQCGFCSASLLVDGRNCRKSRDSQGNFNDCVLEEAAWYKGSFSLGKNAKPCCTSCIQPWTSWKTRQANKVARFWKHSHQICDGCIVTLEIAGAPAIAVAAGAPVVAVAADAPGVAAPAAAPTPQPPPPPLQPPNFNQAVQHLRTMETKVAVLEAQIGEMQVASEVMSQKFEETMVNMQLGMEAKMDAQEQRMSVRMDMRDDIVAVLEAQVEMMSKTIEELQLAMEEKRDAQDNCEAAQFDEETGVQWHNVKSSSPHDEDRIPHDCGRMMMQ
jgi:hypothetical protein